MCIDHFGFVAASCANPAFSPQVRMHVALATAIFPAIGLVMLHFATRRYRKYRYLVQHGVLTTGKVVRKEPSTHQTDNLGDEEQEPLVYDAARPDQAILLDAMPPAIRRRVTGR